MIAQLRGTVVEIGGPTLTLDVNGVGYEVIGSRSLLEKVELGATHQVVIYTDVKEDSIRLFGFTDALEKQVFLMLLKVSGVGSKTALDLVQDWPLGSCYVLLAREMPCILKVFKGVGKKTAGRSLLSCG